MPETIVLSGVTCLTLLAERVNHVAASMVNSRQKASDLVLSPLTKFQAEEQSNWKTVGPKISDKVGANCHKSAVFVARLMVVSGMIERTVE